MQTKRERMVSSGRYILYILAGLIIGWLLFGRGRDSQVNDHVHTDEAGAVTYTCSMHPQVRQDEPGSCPICGMDLIPVADADDHQLDDPFLFSMGEAHSKWASIRTERVEAIHTGPVARLPGRIAVNEREQRLITATFPGRIERLHADFTGRMIRRGEVLATLYSPEMMQAQQELLQAAALRETQPRLYESARARLRLFNLTGQQIDRIEQRGEATPHTDIHAVQSGILTQRAVSQGEYVSTGQTLFAIASLDEVWVELEAYERHLADIREGDPADVRIPAQPELAFTGNVEFINPVLDRQTRSAGVRLTVANPDNLLRPGMLVNATVTATEPHRQQIVVPETSILWTGVQSVVYVVNRQNGRLTFEFREIETGARTAEGYIVHSGLSEGEEIAVSGVFSIDAAAQLRGHFSMMAPPVRAVLPEPFRSNLKKLFDIYFDLKNALAGDDPQEALEHGKMLMEQLVETGEHSLDGEHHMFWMEQYAAIVESLQELTTHDDLAGIRIHFEPLSEAFIETARTLGAIDDTWYVAYCPMVDDDRGAYWLSEFEEIMNPYFGSMMLRCGEVRDILIRI
jgi:membrane fusion protein, copper/silver efflux system